MTPQKLFDSIWSYGNQKEADAWANTLELFAFENLTGKSISIISLVALHWARVLRRGLNVKSNGDYLFHGGGEDDCYGRTLLALINLGLTDARP